MSNMEIRQVNKTMVALDATHVLTFTEYGQAWMIVVNHDTCELEWRKYENIKYVEDTNVTRQ